MMEVEALLAELKISGRTGNLERGKQLHAGARECGLDSCIYVANSLISMYAKCGSISQARKLFDALRYPDVVSWSTLILGYAGNGEGVIALDIFAEMRSRGCAPNSLTFVAALKACISLNQSESGRAECLKWGRLIHSNIGCYMNIYVQNTLIDMYSKCASMLDARKVFDSMKRPSVVSWNAIILGYAANGEGDTALDLFARMKSQGSIPNSVTFLAAFKACTSLVDQDQNRRAECKEIGRQIHSEIGSHLNDSVQNSLIDMYFKCDSISDARKVFDQMRNPTVVSWTALILGYAYNGEGAAGLYMFARMRSHGCAPNAITFVAALKACTALAVKHDTNVAECLEQGRQIHGDVGIHSNIFVQNALIDMYSKCGSMVDARQVFDRMSSRDAVSWNALILGHAENGEPGVALNLFVKMKSQGCAPDCRTFVAALRVCGLLGALESGRKIHVEVETRAEDNLILVTSLVDFYAKCGSMLDAQKAFDSLQPERKDLRVCTALLAGYSRLGDNKAVFALLEEMQNAGLQPDGITLLCILTCCIHSGDLAKAEELFKAMSSKHGLVPAVEHCTCMVDILCRSNRLNNAIALLRSMSCNPDYVTWTTLLGACRKWENVHLGRLAFKSVVILHGTSAPAVYVLMGHIFRSRGMSEEQEVVLSMRRKFSAWKDPAQSCWTNMVGETHVFFAGT